MNNSYLKVLPSKRLHHQEQFFIVVLLHWIIMNEIIDVKNCQYAVEDKSRIRCDVKFEGVWLAPEINGKFVSFLANPKDKEIFLDYLVTNLKLYFDKFEDELQSTVEEPTTSEYDKVKKA